MPAKHAVVIGVNKYANLAEKYQLSGCVNDARLIKSVLVDHFNFDEKNVRELHDEAASQEAILGEMNRLVNEVEKGHIVVFHFSGHGSRRTSKSSDEGSGKDSTIMPSDSGRKPLKNLDINDDQIHEWLGRLTEKTPFITLIFDCCHSGTITRDAFAATVRAVEDDDRSLEDMGIDPAQLPEHEKSSTGEVGPGGWLTLSDRYVVISGCRDNETSREFDLDDGERYSRNGALTYYLTKALMRAKPGSTYRDVFELARQGVNTRFPGQHPQIEGAQDRAIFGVHDIEPLRFIPVAAVNGDAVTLNGGAAHGLQAGSRWAVYPQGTKQTKGGRSLGTIEIRSVGPLTSESVIRESQGDITPGARCVEKVPSAGQRQLQVDLSALPDGARAALAAGVAKSNLLTAALKPNAAEVRAYILEPRTKASADDPMPDIEEIDAPSWAIVDLEGSLSMPLHAVSEDGVIDTLIHNLETTARYRNALSLDNPDSDLDVEFNIFRKKANLELEPANGGDFVFEEGDCLAFELINRESSPIWASILDFDVNGQIEQLYPRNRSSEMIGAGKSITIGSGEQDIIIGLNNFDGDLGSETLKAFLSSNDIDFGWLEQGATRSATTSFSRLRQQFEAAYNGPATRSSPATAQAGEDDVPEKWTAINRSFSIRRK